MVEPQPQYRSISESKAQAAVQSEAQNREVIAIREKFAKELAEAAKVVHFVCCIAHHRFVCETQ